jgi:hypothetical protein
MNTLTKIALGLGLSYIFLKLIATKPIKQQLLTALVDGAYIVIKKKLKN